MLSVIENLEIFKEEMSLKDIPDCEITSEISKIHYTNTDYESNADLISILMMISGLKCQLYVMNGTMILILRFPRKPGSLNVRSNIEIERNSESGELKLLIESTGGIQAL